MPAQNKMKKTHSTTKAESTKKTLAKKETKKNVQKAAGKKTQKKTNKQSELREELKDLAGVEARRDIVRLTAASLLLIITVFLFISLISNIFTGAEDQAGVLSGMMFEAHNKAGFLGAHTSYFLMQQLFGFGSLLIPIFLSCVVLKMMLRAACPLRLWVVFVHSVVIAALISVDATYIQNNFMPETWNRFFGFELGGLHGKEIVDTLEEYVGSTIAFFVLVALTVGYIGYWFTQVFIWIFKGFHKLGRIIFRHKDEDEEFIDDLDAKELPDDADDKDEEEEEDDNGEEIKTEESQEEDDEDSEEADAAELSETDGVIVLNPEDTSTPEPIEDLNGNVLVGEETPAEEEPAAGEKELVIIDGKEEEKSGAKTLEADFDDLLPYDPKADLSRYKYPSVALLEKHTSAGSPTTKEELEANKNRIIQVLRNFSVEISGITATVGPTVTLYEITPAPGVRIAKIRNLEDDIALSLSALGIRIIAPIPGKGTIGIEVPNARPQVVSMESIINTQKFKETKFELPIALGKTITNEMFMVDLAKMPHLLVAGATGQGKSVGLNAIITSLLYKKHPSELKLVMVDPKKVEFSMYNPIINHFLAQVPDSDEPVVTDVKKVINTLKSLCQEMDDRYDLLKLARCRNIKEYNAKFCERHLLPSEGHKYLPYIVVIIDEFGDLIMTAGKEIELPIARIAQLARAVGIHMVIATQSPRATIITGKIKANFPARMAFRVSQGVESQTILDRRGANNLIGRGDMLFQAGSELTRVQCAFVDTPEVVAIAKHIESQQAYPSPFELPLVAEDGSDGMEGMNSQDGSSTFEQVARFVVNTQSGSTSKIQRQFSVGFNRAGRLMDQLEEAGIVGPQMGSKPRQVLVQSEIELQQILAALKEAGQNFE